MRHVAVFAVFALLGVTPLARADAQTARATVPDSVRAVYRDTLLVLRDSTAAVRGAASRFSRDLQFAGSRTVLNRARRLGTACANLRAMLADAQDMFQSSRAPASAREEARALLRSIRELRTALYTNCVNGLAATGPGETADSLRSWGPYHTSRLERHLLTYDDAASGMAQAMDVKLEPRLP